MARSAPSRTSAGTRLFEGIILRSVARIEHIPQAESCRRDVRDSISGLADLSCIEEMTAAGCGSASEDPHVTGADRLPQTVSRRCYSQKCRAKPQCRPSVQSASVKHSTHWKAVASQIGSGEVQCSSRVHQTHLDVGLHA